MSATIQCPVCGSPTSVGETRRVTPQQTRRRRVCDAMSCGKKFSTVEIVVTESLDRALRGEITLVRQRDLQAAFRILSLMLGIAS